LTCDTLREEGDDRENGDPSATERQHSSATGGGVLLAPTPAQLIAETDMELYRRKQNAVTVRYVSGDRIVAVLEIVSPGNKSSRQALDQFVKKAAELLDRQIHLMILDLQPRG
jgi:hypothetical protein